MKTPLLLALGSIALWGQGPAAKPEFEVASVRPSATSGQDGVSLGLHLDGSQARIAAFTLKDYIAMAYRVKAYQVSGPDWIGSERFDLNAKLPAGASASQIPEMLQALLADRFQLTFHSEKKELPVYALVVGKPPLKLTEVPASADDNGPPGTNFAASGSGAGVSVNMGNGTSYAFANNKFEAKKISMDLLATMLERYMDRPILNLTELKGRYDVTLQLTPEDYRAMLIRAGVSAGMVFPPQVLAMLDGNSGLSLLDALQQTGLKLEARKAPIDFVVIDQVRKTPTDN